MKLFFKIIVILLVGWLLLALLLPSKPQPLEIVFLEACSFPLPEDYLIEDRSHSYSLAPQGVWYSENMVIRVSESLAPIILKALKNNKDFELKDGYYEKFIAGKVLANCSIEQNTSVVNIKYVLW